jgi:hypothetical protein
MFITSFSFLAALINLLSFIKLSHFFNNSINYFPFLYSSNFSFTCYKFYFFLFIFWLSHSFILNKMSIFFSQTLISLFINFICLLTLI